MHHQFFKNSYAPVYHCAMARQLLDPLKILNSDLIFSILAGNKKQVAQRAMMLT